MASSVDENVELFMVRFREVSCWIFPLFFSSSCPLTPLACRLLDVSLPPVLLRALLAFCLLFLATSSSLPG